MSLRTKQVCPHCNSTAIGVFPGITVGCYNEQQRMIANNLDAALYTCGDCGYCETYLRLPVKQWPNPPEKSKQFAWLPR